ncbi:hypothetical protein [Ornithinimicrobium kibberense]|uniref:hypothetical protein n=1 Tax=Ornithinimicrobium kibberense TaxID=282060 RepID=UPI0036099B44
MHGGRVVGEEGVEPCGVPGVHGEDGRSVVVGEAAGHRSSWRTSGAGPRSGADTRTMSPAGPVLHEARRGTVAGRGGRRGPTGPERRRAPPWWGPLAGVAGAGFEPA